MKRKWWSRNTFHHIERLAPHCENTKNNCPAGNNPCIYSSALCTTCSLHHIQRNSWQSIQPQARTHGLQNIKQQATTHTPWHEEVSITYPFHSHITHGAPSWTLGCPTVHPSQSGTCIPTCNCTHTSIFIHILWLQGNCHHYKHK